MTGKKVYKQKGTGGARHGSKRAPIFVGGGVTFGPHGNKNSALSLPRRQRARSLAQAFSLKSTQVSLMVDLDLAKGKTAIFAKAFDRIDHKANSMIMVIAPSERALARGMRNLSAVSVCYADQVNSYDVIRADQVVMSEEAVTILTSRLTVKKNDKKSETVVVAPEAVEPLEPELVETVEKPVVTKSVAKTVVKKPAVKKPVIKKPTVKKPAATTKTKTVKTKKTA
jgi:large subunit ribosomal protein L4